MKIISALIAVCVLLLPSFSAARERDGSQRDLLLNRGETFADYLRDFSRGDIFSLEIPGEPFLPGPGDEKTAEVIVPSLPSGPEIFYRGRVEMGGKTIAMIEVVGDDGGKNYFLSKGEPFGKYRLRDIGKDHVTVEKPGGGTEKILFSEEKI